MLSSIRARRLSRSETSVDSTRLLARPLSLARPCAYLSRRLAGCGQGMRTSEPMYGCEVSIPTIQAVAGCLCEYGRASHFSSLVAFPPPSSLCFSRCLCFFLCVCCPVGPRFCRVAALPSLPLFSPCGLPFLGPPPCWFLLPFPFLLARLVLWVCAPCCSCCSVSCLCVPVCFSLCPSPPSLGLG